MALRIISTDAGKRRAFAPKTLCGASQRSITPVLGNPDALFWPQHKAHTDIHIQVKCQYK